MEMPNEALWKAQVQNSLPATRMDQATCHPGYTECQLTWWSSLKSSVCLYILHPKTKNLNRVRPGPRPLPGGRGPSLEKSPGVVSPGPTAGVSVMQEEPRSGH